MKLKLIINSTLLALGISQSQLIAQQGPPILSNAQTSFQHRLNQLVAREDQKRHPEQPFDMEFPGGPVEFLVKALKERINPPPNILIAPGLQDVFVPAFDFQNVTLTELLQALNSLAVEGKSGIWQPGNSDKIWVFNPAPGRGPLPGGNLPTWLKGTTPGFQAASDPTGLRSPAPPAAPEQTCMIFPVGRLMQGYKVEDITTAIQTAWKMTGKTDATMKFHEDTDLLLVLGDREQLRIVREVLNSVEESLVSKLDAAGRAARQKDSANPAKEDSH